MTSKQALFLILLVACSLPAFADTLWAVNSGTSYLWQIDTTTGAATQVVKLSTAVEWDLTELNGTLYVASNAAGGSGISTIDPVSGAVTLISSAASPQGLAANPGLSSLYGDGSSEGGLNIIQPDGSRTQIGGNGGDGAWDLAYDAADGVLYGWNGFTLGLDIIDTTTGNVDQISSGAFSGRPRGTLAWDGNDDTLYLLMELPGYLDPNQTDVLYSVNTTTGALTGVGDTGVSGVQFVGMADLQASPTPEPSTTGLIGFGLAGVAGLGLRRRRASRLW